MVHRLSANFYTTLVSTTLGNRILDQAYSRVALLRTPYGVECSKLVTQTARLMWLKYGVLHGVLALNGTATYCRSGTRQKNETVDRNPYSYRTTEYYVVNLAHWYR